MNFSLLCTSSHLLNCIQHAMPSIFLCATARTCTDALYFYVQNVVSKEIKILDILSWHWYIAVSIRNYFECWRAITYDGIRPILVEKRWRSEWSTQSPGCEAAKDWFLKLFLLQIMIWNLGVVDAVISNPVKILDAHKDVVLSMSFNTDGSLLATACRDRKIRVIDPRAGTVLQVGWVQRFMVHLISRLGVFPLLGTFIAIKDDASALPKALYGAVPFYFAQNACCHCWRQGFCILIPCSLLLETLLDCIVFIGTSCSPLRDMGGNVEIRWWGGCKCTFVPMTNVSMVVLVAWILLARCSWLHFVAICRGLCTQKVLPGTTKDCCLANMWINS